MKFGLAPLLALSLAACGGGTHGGSTSASTLDALPTTASASASASSYVVVEPALLLLAPLGSSLAPGAKCQARAYLADGTMIAPGTAASAARDLGVRRDDGCFAGAVYARDGGLRPGLVLGDCGDAITFGAWSDHRLPLAAYGPLAPDCSAIVFFGDGRYHRRIAIIAVAATPKRAAQMHALRSQR